MSTQNSGIAAQLIQGSRNIDRMKEETHALVTGIFGHIDPGDAYRLGESRSKIITGGGYEWKVGYDYSEQCFVVSCTFTETSPSGRVTSIRPVYSLGVYYRNKKKENEDCTHYRNVQCAYEGLDVLITGMIETFPDLAWHLEPLMKAAGVQF